MRLRKSLFVPFVAPVYKWNLSKILNFFDVQEERWTKADGVFKRIWNVIRNPSRAFWDITHKGDNKGGFLILLLNGFTIGLWSLAVYIHINIGAFQSIPNISLFRIVYGGIEYFLGIFLIRDCLLSNPLLYMEFIIHNGCEFFHKYQ